MIAGQRPKLLPHGRLVALRTRGVTAVALLALVAVLLQPAVAQAHAMLKSSNPPAGARLTTVPQSIRLMFTESPDLTFTRIELFDAGDASVTLGTVGYAPDSKRAVLVAIRGALDAGVYTVVWQTAGDDGHPTHGQFSFTIAPGASGTGRATTGGEAAGGVTAPGQLPPARTHHAGTSMPGENSFGAASPLYVAIRWLQFAALLTVVGAVVFRLVVLGFMARERAPRLTLIAHAATGAARLGFVGVTLLGIAALLRLGAQSYAMHGAANVWDIALVGSMLGKTVWGWAWLLQLAGIVGAFVGFARARHSSEARPFGGWVLALLSVAVLAFTPAVSGHAVSAPRLMGLAVLADGLHVIGAGGWLGSLLFVLAVGIPTALRLEADERGPAVADLVDAFSPTALAFAGATATTGVFAAWLHLGTVRALWETAYGQTLLVKLAVLSIVAATGAYNWLRVRPALGDIEGARRVRRSATVEIAVGVLVLAVTAVLVAMPTAADEVAMSAPAVASTRACPASFAASRCPVADSPSSSRPST